MITFFSAVSAINIKLDANYAAFFPYGQADETYVSDHSKTGTTPIVAQRPQREKSNTEETGTVVSQEKEGIILPIQDGQTEPDYPYGGTLLVLVEADNLYTPEIFNAMQECLHDFVARREVGEPFSVFDFFTFEKRGSRLAMVPISTHEDIGNIPWTDEEVEHVQNLIENDPNLKFFLTSEDCNSVMFSFPIGGFNNAMMDEFSAAFDPLRAIGCRVYTNGGAVISAKVMEYLQKDLVTLVGLCLIVILLTFYFSFKSVRSIFLPASLSVIAIIWTLGSMNVLGYTINILNIVTPCMVITLGSAYSVHILNEYYVEFLAGRKGNTATVASIKIVKTIILASATTIFGFLCLGVSETTGLKDFGISVSLGILYCAILATTYIPAMLTIFPEPSKTKALKQSKGILNKLIEKIAIIVPKAWILLIIIALLLFAGYLYTNNRISLDSNYMSYFPKSDEFGRESRHFAEKMGGTTPFYVTLEAPEGSNRFFMNAENLADVWIFEQQIRKDNKDILQILSYPSYVAFANKTLTGKEGIPDSNGLLMMMARLVMMVQNYSGGTFDLSGIISQDGNSITLIVQNWDSVEKDLMTTSSIERVRETLIDNINILPDGTYVTLSGDPMVNLKFTKTLFADQNRSTILSIFVVLILTVITFRSLIKGIYCIIPVICGIFINYIFMYSAGIPFDIITVSFTSIAIGCGVDDAIHFTLRYSKNREIYCNEKQAETIKRTIEETGRPIILTTLSIVLGMMMLSFASYTPIRYFGLLMSVTLGGCMVSTILFLPATILLKEQILSKAKK